MIKIEITRTTEEKWTQKENVITKETPTQVTKQKDSEIDGVKFLG